MITGGLCSSDAASLESELFLPKPHLRPGLRAHACARSGVNGLTSVAGLSTRGVFSKTFRVVVAGQLSTSVAPNNSCETGTENRQQQRVWGPATQFRQGLQQKLQH